jgi:hypothetical protein
MSISRILAPITYNFSHVREATIHLLARNKSMEM